MSLDEDFWRWLLLRILPQSFKRSRLLSTFTIYELAIEADEFHRLLNENTYPCLIVRDQNSGVWSTADPSAIRSKIPLLLNTRFSIIIFGRFAIANGSSITEYEKKYLNLDLEPDEHLPFNFIDTDTVLN